MMVWLIRQCGFAVIVIWKVIFTGASECGTGECAVSLFDVLACKECIRGTSVSQRVVVIEGSEVT